MGHSLCGLVLTLKYLYFVYLTVIYCCNRLLFLSVVSVPRVSNLPILYGSLLMFGTISKNYDCPGSSKTSVGGG